ncbi:ankyrin repeat domain-containing protein [Streptomyces sp. NPDC057474]|uniref:ankyrin repeat domain-containing protein n=1 Tax=Streptomyces sp. NPDC057474 TaxID=3346144 RepID=UPI0036935C9D
MTQIGACPAMPHTRELAKLRDAVLGDRCPASVPRVQRIEEALALAPADPFFLWARIAELRWFARQDQSCEWMDGSEGEERLDDSLARAFAVLERREDTHADLRALSRLAHLVAGLSEVDQRPDTAALARARAHADAYEVTRQDDYEPYEDELRPGDLLRALKARCDSWAAAIKTHRDPEEDFLFVSAAVQEDEKVLRWALDPVAVLPDFQAWARTELPSRRLTSPAKNPLPLGGFFSLHFDFYGTVPQPEMPNLVLGRLLAALLVGNRDLIAGAADAIDQNFPEGLETLLHAGLDANASWSAKDKETLLHHSVKSNRTRCAEVLVRYGANPAATNVEGQTPVGIATSIGRPAMLRALGVGGVAQPTYIDLSGLPVAARRLPGARLNFWASGFGRRNGHGLFAQLITAVLSSPIEVWDELLDGPLLDKLPWKHLALAVTVRELGLTAQAPASLGQKPHFVPGSIRVRGPLVLSAPLIVAGDLHVDGAIVDNSREDGHLVVAGDVEADALVTDNSLLVAGDCRIRDFIWGNDNSHQLTVDGAVRTPLLVLTNHSIEYGDMDVEHGLDDPDTDELAARFVEEALDRGNLSRDKLLALFRAGEPALKPTPA